LKKHLIIIFSLLAILKTQAQDYLISFAGSGASTTVDSVQVQNLTQGTGLTLNGTDFLYLMGVVGINSVNNDNNNMLNIFPNPSSDASFIEFEAISPGIVYINLQDITGKQLILNENNLQLGVHTFTLSGLGSGVYTLSIKSANYSYTGKIVRSRIQPGNPKITYVSSNLISMGQTMLKHNLSLIPMQYNNGDRLLFKCFSGIYSTVIPLVPAQSQMVIANFVACTDADNNNYATVTIGTQIWMAENLNVGVLIDGNNWQANNGTFEKYCYNDDASMCIIYGGLYQWDEMMQYVTNPSVQAICPLGWHIPTDAEWCTITQYLDSTIDYCVYGWNGINAGGKMKSTGTIEDGTGLWYTPNTGATNESGFSAIPGGYHTRGLGGQFSRIHFEANWWSSSTVDNINAWSRLFENYESSVGMGGASNDHGYSVRCLRNP
jgi:uncharacterized protein (TIGR02145 family)